MHSLHRRPRSIARVVSDTRGAIDLASIMVGVLVIGIVGSVIAATVFAVIPWSQDEAAKQTLNSVTTAESVNRVQDGRYVDYPGLRAAGRIQKTSSLVIGTDAPGACYVAVSKSVTGNLYFITDRLPSPARYTTGIDAGCDGVAIDDLVGQLIGEKNMFAALTVDDNNTTRNWSSVAFSEDGRRAVASVLNGYLYTSTNGGGSWTELTESGSRAWSDVAISADGNKITATVKDGFIYTSVDGGQKWTERSSAGKRAWTSVTSSNDGTNLSATSSDFDANGYLAGETYSSSDSGATWSDYRNIRAWSSAAYSADGSIAVGSVKDGYIYTSTDAGSNWVERTAAGARAWTDVAVSADGKRIAATVNDGFIYTSTDSGSSWTQRGASRAWSSVATTSTGKTIVATVKGAGIVRSFDGGATWSEGGVDGRNWNSVAVSADGTRMIAASTSALYLSKDSGVTWMPFTPVAPVSTTWPDNTVWTSVASSADGMNLTVLSAFDYNRGAGIVATSSDGGVTWTNRLGLDGNTWTSATYSTDGTKLAVAGATTSIISADSGATWSTLGVYAESLAMSGDGSRILGNADNRSAAISVDGGALFTVSQPAQYWVDSASSADGKIVVAVARQPTGQGALWRSGDHGHTWRALASSVYTTWNTVAISDDGAKIVAGATDGKMYRSSDSGVTMVASPAPSGNWLSITSSPDGVNLMAQSVSSGTWKSSDSGASWTKVSSTGFDGGVIASAAAGSKVIAASPGYPVAVSPNAGAYWSSSSPFGNWTKVAGSADGKKLVGMTGEGRPLILSDDFGHTWRTSSSPAHSWLAVASSADGSVLAATSKQWQNGYMYVSLDSGVTWSGRAVPSSQAFEAIAVSPDGQKISIGSDYGIYSSVDTGRSWSRVSVVDSRTAIAASADGLKVATASPDSVISTSVDGGVTWTPRPAAGSRKWSSLDASADGTKIVGVVAGGSVFTSADSGATWTERADAGSRSWAAVTSSADGAVLAAVVTGGNIYTSINSGKSWVENKDAGPRPWTSISSSDDGRHMVATVSGSTVFTLTFGPK
jgi:hypothetical protein